MVIKISAKCSDLFSMEGPNGLQYSGYVPDFFPDEHFCDYVMLTIDTRSGKILNWGNVLDSQVKEVFKQSRRAG